MLYHFNSSAIGVVDPKTPPSFLKNQIQDALKETPKVRLDLFVMSFCPYGINAEKAIVPILKEMGEKIDFNIYFIASSGPDGTLQSLHGSSEVLEDRRQLVISKHFPTHFPDYLTARLSNYPSTDWTTAARVAGLDVNMITRLVDSDIEMEMFLSNIALGNIRRVFNSPSLFINGKYFNGPFLSVSEETATGTCSGGFRDGESCTTTTSSTDGCPDACENGNNAGGMCNGKGDPYNCPGKCIGGKIPGRNCGRVGDPQCPGICIGGDIANDSCIDGHYCPGGTCSQATCEAGSCTNKGTCIYPLPVELFDFAGSVSNNNQVLLTWKTATEQNNKGFEIEQSSDGESWNEKTFINGHDVSDVIEQYQWVDNTPAQGINYYRLKQIDYDSNFTYSPIIAIRITPATNFLVQAFPNPARTSANLLFSGDIEGEVAILIFDTRGQKVLNKPFTVNKGDNILPLDLGQLASGTFSISVEYKGTSKASTRLTVIK